MALTAYLLRNLLLQFLHLLTEHGSWRHKLCCGNSLCHKALWEKEAWQDFPHFLVDSPSHVMALPAEKSLSCVIDEIHVSPFCSLTYYFFKRTGCRGLGRVVWVLRFMGEEFLSGFAGLLFGCCSSAVSSRRVCAALAALGSPGTVLDTG